MNLSSELNQSCEVLRLFGHQELSESFELALRYFVLGYNIVLFPFSLSLTGLIIFLIIKFKHLQQTTFFLALQLAILDFSYVVTFTPAAITATIGGQWITGIHTCIISGGEFVFIYQLRNWLMFVFVCDRFCTIFFYFGYNQRRRKVILILCLTALALSAISAVLPAILGCIEFNRVLWLCTSPVYEICHQHDFCQLYTITIVVIGQLAGSYIPMVMYLAVFIKAKRMRNQFIRSGAPENRKRDRKANITFFTLFISLIGVNIPPLFAYFLLTFVFAPLEVQPPEALLLVLYLLQQLYTLLPIMDSIAIIRNAEMKKAIKLLKNKLTNQRERMDRITSIAILSTVALNIAVTNTAAAMGTSATCTSADATMDEANDAQSER